MRFPPRDTWSLESELPPDQLASRLREETAGVFSLSSPKPLVGWVEGDRFCVFHCPRPFAERIFRPKMRGTIEPRGPGSRVEVCVAPRSHAPWVLVGSVLLLGLSRILSGLLDAMIDPSATTLAVSAPSATALILPLTASALVWGLCLASFWFHAGASREALRSVLAR